MAGEGHTGWGVWWVSGKGNNTGMTVNWGMLLSTELNICLPPNSVIKRGSTKGDSIRKWEARNLGNPKASHFVEERKWSV